MALRRLAILVLWPALAPSAIAPADAARQWRESHERAILDELVELLRLPNLPQDPASLRRNAEAVARLLERRGVATRLLETSGAPPVVYGELASAGARQTITFYAHYDGAPVEAARWYTGNPFRPVLMSTSLEAGGQPIPLPNPGWPSDPEWRLYARSAADDKAAIIALAVALEALRVRQLPLSSNVKFFVSGEHESGSPHLAQILRAHRALLRSDLWLFCDGAVHPNRQQQLVFGARGYAGIDLTVYGPRQELDSARYANWAPNPAFLLARLIASMRDDSGKVLIEGFHHGALPLGRAELQALAQVPNFDATLKRDLWLAETEGGTRTLAEALSLPALNLSGLLSGAVTRSGPGRIPALAKASLEVHLVAGMDHRLTVNRILEHIRKQGFYVTETEPGESLRRAHPRICYVERRPGFNPVRTPMDLELARRVIAAVEEARGPVIKLPALEASLPASTVAEILEVPAIFVPMANHDGNQHGANENLRLQNLWEGIEVMAALLALPAAEPASN
jgi:acetylornithine deacetylase/succinyl-diaminopimelate desuccinylase-like protein